MGIQKDGIDALDIRIGVPPKNVARTHPLEELGRVLPIDGYHASSKDTSTSLFQSLYQKHVKSRPPVGYSSILYPYYWSNSVVYTLGLQGPG